MTDKDKADFWSRVDRSGDCWVWTWGKQHGYGMFSRHGEKWRAHRLSYIWANGEIPEGLYVCHKCDNPPCVNPSHLFVGTCGDNVRDCFKKGRAPRRKGEQHGRAKLTNKNVQVIKRLYATKRYSQADLANMYNVSRSAIQWIVSSGTWKHLLEREAA